MKFTFAFLLFFAALLGATTASASGGEWMTDYEAARAKAKADDKPLLLNFTGSDWCPPCQYLHKNVFATETFKEYAKEEVVLVELDFPRRKAQDEALKAQNRKLAEKFEIEGFPTVILMSPAGEVLDKTVGVAHSDVDSFIKHVRSVVR